MTIPNTSFIITLTKTPYGYLFHSVALGTASGKRSQGGARVRSNKISNRLIKEIGMLQEDDPNLFPPNHPASDPTHPPDPSEQVDIDCEVRRTLFQRTIPPSFTKDCMSKDETIHFPNYRNFIVDAYHAHPTRYLTFIACRKVLRGNVSTLMRIYKYLIKIGLINYNLSYRGNYTFLNQTTPLMPPPSQLPPLASMPAVDTDALTFVSINKYFSRALRIYCDRCKLIAGVVWYTAQSINLCSECHALCYPSTKTTQYEERRTQKQEEECRRQQGYANISAEAFTMMDIVKKVEQTSKEVKTQKSMWSIEQNIKLLDFMGVDQGRSWKQLLKIFQNRKNIQDVIVQFMQFPIVNVEKEIHLEDQLEHPMEEHIQFLDQYYQQSQYCVKENTQQQTKYENHQEKQKYKINEFHTSQENKEQSNGHFLHSSQRSRKFDKIAKMILQKYFLKIQNLGDIQKCIDATNIKITNGKLLFKCDQQ